MMMRLIRIVRHGTLSTLDEQIPQARGEDESAMQIQSEYEAKIAARKIFNNVAKPGAKYFSVIRLPTYDPNVLQWRRPDQMVLAWLTSSVSEAVLGQVLQCDSAANIWHTLEQLYGTLSRARVQQIKGELQGLAKGSLSVTDCVQKAKQLSITLACAGKPVDDNDLIMWILRGLGSEYDPEQLASNCAVSEKIHFP